MLGGRLPETENTRICNFWPKKWSRSLNEWWSLTRELLKQYLTEKQNGCLRSGRYERVDCIIVVVIIIIIIIIFSVARPYG